MELTEFEKSLITDALKRCFGLAEFIFGGKDERTAIDTLANQTGLRVKRIEETINEIKQML